ncbi:unnamed protein product [Rotaria magnacalcarata]|uniref:Uncharacterized protein n=1 Tax=Rotaria magnacalcarata TaxID=392030 RepID=A0A815ZRA1_9BILA|nr:unnamed protein product [Rotaria magnacalcarata]
MGFDCPTEADRVPGHGPIVGSDGKKSFSYSRLKKHFEPSERKVANDIKLIIHNDDQVKSVDDRERQPSTPLHKYAHQHRTKEARRRRNHIRNNTFLMRRFRYCIKYNIHYQFKMKLIKAILRQNEIKHTHVKVVDGLLIIGFRHDMLKQQDQHHHHHHHRHHEHHREQ